MDRTSHANLNVTINAFCSVLLGSLLLAGCGGGGDLMTTYPAGGTAKFQGKPMQHARITLYPVARDEKHRAVLSSGVVGEDGEYRLTTYRYGDGAPAGEYKLTIVWPSGPDSESELPGFIADRLKGRYSDREKSTIQVKIESGENTLTPIELN